MKIYIVSRSFRLNGSPHFQNTVLVITDDKEDALHMADMLAMKDSEDGLVYSPAVINYQGIYVSESTLGESISRSDSNYPLEQVMNNLIYQVGIIK